MSIASLTDKNHPPTKTQISKTLGTKKSLWDELVRFLADNYAIPAEWNYGGIKYGWNLWYRQSGKTLVTLYPQANAFVAQVVLGKEHAAKALALKLGKNVGTLLKETPQLHDGRWLFIKVKTAKDIRDIEQLLTLKRRPKLLKPA